MGQRVYEYESVTAAAGAENTEKAFESSNVQKRKLKRVCVNANTALVYLVIYHDREQICNIPLDCKPLVDKWVDIDREIPAGGSVDVGINNGTGASVTVKVGIETEIEA